MHICTGQFLDAVVDQRYELRRQHRRARVVVVADRVQTGQQGVGALHGRQRHVQVGARAALDQTVEDAARRTIELTLRVYTFQL